jgi:hypothetical protein
MALAVAVLGVVSLASLATVLVCVRTLASAAQERRADHVRSLVAERKAELATTSMELAAATVAETARPHEAEPLLQTQTGGPRSKSMRTAMAESLMDPDDPGDMETFTRMSDAGYDPTSPEDRDYYNAMTQAGVM